MSLKSLPLEIWAGVECTVNRVGDEYSDQLEQNGHANRLKDLDLFAELGISAIRYPVLWERTAPNSLDEPNWLWADERLHRLKALGIRPIVGLVHHGSGPRYTSLVDPEFPEKLAAFARMVADRYPWIDYYTPVNEPLTTARFSGLYGHWYPHGKDDLTFARALLNQCRAIALSMQAIREINPNAQLVQTDDLGQIFSTPLLAYQAELENERRWLSFDLLCGRLNRDRPTWDYLLSAGITEAELNWFLDNPCPPDIMGINHYLTSDRFLDERLERYPKSVHGGNAKQAYADVEAVRVCAQNTMGVGKLLQAAWQRYNLPLAVTEVHLGCTREEQLRWLYEVWQAANEQKQTGVDVRAITAWSLLGAYDWNSLLTRFDGYYEPGVFDLRSPRPRRTALARAIANLAQDIEPNHPLLNTPGWWHREERLLYPPVGDILEQIQAPPTQPLIIVGATGTLGQAFARACTERGIFHYLLSRQQIDITSPASVEAALGELNPWAVINAAGYVRVDDAEREVDACLLANTEGAANLAIACVNREIALMTFSSDLVFDGSVTTPYTESDPVAPLNVYGRSKAIAEEKVLSANPASLVVRTSAFFSPWDEYNFVTLALRQLEAGNTFIATDDIVSPTYVPDLVNASLDLFIDGECGLWHLANQGAIAWADLAKLAAKQAGINSSKIIACHARELGLIAQRPTYSVLGSNRGLLMPCLDDAIARYLHQKQPH
ncbi:family 1 glycosylhydrolase [Aliterella atlantica]|uniref:dTDP-4-dehydrorhamnose reductase n=1 Tax=Aliterella atlantica CENA595 TaxID=1618023 RepID=A0A0D8ZQA6_9CYAN|nr:family 1 glycosylhydrolase [Aliterella atlantica]KJH70998.1 dTDP-4-dehydrorhamnose reductase [Aliterella atlantica CENA595]